VPFLFGPVLFVIFSCPRPLGDGIERPLVKGLAKKLGANPTPMHLALRTAAGYHGRNPAVALDLLGSSVALPLSPHGGNQPRHQSRSGAGEGVHEGIVRMHASELVNLFVIKRDGRQNLFQQLLPMPRSPCGTR
jgi:hypothetical protein